MDNSKHVNQENNESIKVMEVFHFTKDEMHVDYFTEKEYIEVIESFFLKGGLEIPESIDDNKTISQLTDNDCKLFFEELGYEVTGFSTYNPEYHKELQVPFKFKDLKDDKENIS